MLPLPSSPFFVSDTHIDMLTAKQLGMAGRIFDTYHAEQQASGITRKRKRLAATQKLFLHSYTRAVESDFCRPYAMLLIAVEITGIIIITWHEIVENLSFIGYDKGIN